MAEFRSKSSRGLGFNFGRFSSNSIDHCLDSGSKASSARNDDGGWPTLWSKLAFLPLYGKETGRARVELAENTIELQTELYQAKKISSRLLGATLIMANKMIDKDRLREIWEKI